MGTAELIIISQLNILSQGVYLSVHLRLSKTTCYHWWRNRIWVSCDRKDWVSGKFAAPDYLVWQCTAFPSIRLQRLEFHHSSTESGIPLLFVKVLCKLNETLCTTWRCSGLARLQSRTAVTGNSSSVWNPYSAQTAIAQPVGLLPHLHAFSLLTTVSIL